MAISDLGAPRPVSPRRPGNARLGSIEARWFASGDIEDELRPRGRGRRRTDVYHLASLGPESSLKRRDGSGPLEWKTRIGHPEPCEIAGVPGVRERWVKRRLRERDLNQALDGAWVDVHKRVWRAGGVEIGRLEIDAAQWWTIAVPGGRPSKTVRKILASWAPILRARGEPASYPTWVLDVHTGRAARGRLRA